MSRAGLSRAVLCAGAAVLLAPPSLGAVVLCGDSEEVPVGEMRYRAVSGADEAYANAYADGGAEITLPAGVTIGCYEGGNSYVSVVHMEDTSSDCSATVFEMMLEWSSTKSGDCPSAPSSVSHTYVVDRCSSPYFASDIVYASARLRSVPTNNYYAYWRGTLTVSGAEAETSDAACWHVLP